MQSCSGKINHKEQLHVPDRCTRAARSLQQSVICLPLSQRPNARIDCCQPNCRLPSLLPRRRSLASLSSQLLVTPHLTLDPAAFRR